MRQLLPLIPLSISCLLLEASQPFHIYSPSSKEKTLWIVKATPNGERLSLKVAQRVNFDFPGRVITAHPSKPFSMSQQRAVTPARCRGRWCT